MEAVELKEWGNAPGNAATLKTKYLCDLNINT
jgi:hypothetical protein